MSVFGVIVVHIFPHSDWIRICIQSECGKMWTKITLSTDSKRVQQGFTRSKEYKYKSLFLCTFLIFQVSRHLRWAFSKEWDDKVVSICCYSCLREKHPNCVMASLNFNNSPKKLQVLLLIYEYMKSRVISSFSLLMSSAFYGVSPCCNAKTKVREIF